MLLLLCGTEGADLAPADPLPTTSTAAILGTPHEATAAA